MNALEITPTAHDSSTTRIVSELFSPTGELDSTQTGYAVAPDGVMAAALLLELTSDARPEGSSGPIATHTTADGEVITGTLTGTGATIQRDFPDGDRQVVTLTRIQDLAAA